MKISLPSIEDYKKINENQDSVRILKSTPDQCLVYNFNYQHPECSPSKKNKHLTSQGTGLVRADSYSPTRLKLYCIQGNAAEMTSTEGIAVGGSYHHFASESFSDKVQTYKSEETWLGFRCIITLH